MGIHGLYVFVRKKAPSAITECSIDQLAGKTAALDGNSFLYKFTYFYGGDLDKICNDMEDLLTFLVQNKVRPICVFDGPGVVPHKARTLQERRDKRVKTEQKISELQLHLDVARQNEAKTSVSTIVPAGIATGAGVAAPVVEHMQQEQSSPKSSSPSTTSGTPSRSHTSAQAQTASQDAHQIANANANANTNANASGNANANASANANKTTPVVSSQVLQQKIAQLQKASMRVRQSDVDVVMQRMQAKNFTCIRAESESDYVLAHLSRQKLVDFVMGDDADFLALGVTRVVRGLQKHRTTRAMLECYDRPEILRCLKLNDEQFTDLCVMMGCDYAGTVATVGPVKSYQGILKHKTLERFVQHLDGVKKKPSRAASKAKSKAKTDGKNASTAMSAAPKAGATTTRKRKRSEMSYDETFLADAAKAREIFRCPPNTLDLQALVNSTQSALSTCNSPSGPSGSPGSASDMAEINLQAPT
jgi:5'-3' exonuclease